MNKNYVLLFLLFGFFNITAQINFLNNKVINGDDCNSGGTFEAISSDIDNDGDLDVVSSSNNGIVGWYENIDGQGNFGYLKSIARNLHYSNTIYVVVCDIDNDLDNDVLVSCKVNEFSDGDLLLYKNEGSGVFSNEIIIATDVNMGVIAVADLNNDSYLDIVATESGAIKWFKNLNGQGTFLKTTITTRNSNSYDIKDIDGDGDKDILAYTRETNDNYNFVFKIVLIRNINAQGMFSPSEILNTITIQSNSSFFSINAYFQNIDNDIDNDIVFYINKNIYTITNTNGLGLFNEAVKVCNWGDSLGNTQPGFKDMEFKDMDNDGDLDMITVINLYNSVSLNYFKRHLWFENNETSINYVTSNILLDDYIVTDPNVFEVIDIDGDNQKDLLVGDIGGNELSLSWHKNFSIKKYISKKCTDYNSSSFIDIDGDGDKDIVSIGPSFNLLPWYENIDGNGTISLQKFISFDEMVTIQDYGYIDSDSLIDFSSGNRWYKNNGNGTFTTYILNSSSSIIISKIIDVDSDGKNDIVFGTSGSNDAFIGWMKNIDGAGNFGELQILATVTGSNQSIRKIVFEDFDNDNNKDFIVFTKSYVIFIKALNNFGSFNNSWQWLYNYPCSDCNFILSSDIDGDDDLDLIFNYEPSFFYSSFKIVKNNGNATFSDVQTINNLSKHSSINFSDIDNDGDSDIVGFDKGGFKTIFYENLDGLGNFNFNPIELIKHSNENYSISEPVDFDNDGNKDILYSNYSISPLQNNISWFKNLGLSNNKIVGNTKLDIDNNGCSSLDQPMQNVRIINNSDVSQPVKSTLTNNSGYYQFYIPNPGTYTTVVSSTLPNYFTASPSTHTNTFLTNDTVQTSDFCILSIQTINNLEIVIYQSSETRPGFKASYILSYRNVGTTMKTGSINLQYENSKILFFSSIPNISSQLSNELVFNYANLHPTETRNINIIFNVLTPPAVNIGDILNFTATIYPIENDDVPDDNTYNLSQVVIGSFDPNDINVIEGNSIYSNQIDDYLHYIIRFQNTGTASAINVRINNVLDDNLDWNTIQIDGSSHSYTNEIVNGKNVAFIFDNVFLPSSSTNEIGSQGYIAYKIKPKSNSQVGDIFTNNADIYFDYNLPIRTNTVNTEILENLAINQFENASINLYPNPTNGKLTIDSKMDISSIIITNIYGQNVMEITNTKEINISEYNNGIYFIKIKDKTGTVLIKKVIKN